jgi:hypothetical protein
MKPTLFGRIIRKHDWVWNQKARWPLAVRVEVCGRLWKAAIQAALMPAAKF